MRILTSIIILALLISDRTMAQSATETEIRDLENREREAILKGDTARLYQLMSQKIIVHNPENTIVGFSQIVERIRTGRISYASFERKIENIAFINSMAVVMGEESLVPQGNAKNSGKTVKRRFTNIWTKENNEWKLTVRHATIISIN